MPTPAWDLSKAPLDRIQYGWALSRMHWALPDFSEGPRAYVERREPQWAD
jgi:hypothetical protein